MTTLQWPATLTIVLILVAGALIAGLIVVLARNGKRNRDPNASIIRSWIAITLVIGLLVLSAATLGLDDQTLRSTLIGGLTASAGGAIAFYFSSKSADQARQDLIGAAFGKENVPNLTGKTSEQARITLGGTSFKLSPENPPPDQSTPIKTQDPLAGVETVRASTIAVTYAAGVEVPNLLGQTTAEAQKNLSKFSLALSSAPPPNAGDKITGQEPIAGAAAWEGGTVAVTYDPRS